MCSVLQRREPPEVLVGDLAAGGTQPRDRVIEAFSVPEHERVDRETQRAELVFLGPRGRAGAAGLRSPSRSREKSRCVTGT